MDEWEEDSKHMSLEIFEIREVYISYIDICQHEFEKFVQMIIITIFHHTNDQIHQLVSKKLKNIRIRVANSELLVPATRTEQFNYIHLNECIKFH